MLKNPHTIRKRVGHRGFWCCGLTFTQVKKHLAWLLCSEIIHDRLAATRGAFQMHLADPVELLSSQFSLQAASKGD